MNLVLLVSFEHVLSGRHVCVHHLIALKHIFYSSHNNPTLEISYFLHNGHMPLLRWTPKHLKNTLTRSHAPATTLD